MVLQKSQIYYLDEELHNLVLDNHIHLSKYYNTYKDRLISGFLNFMGCTQTVNIQVIIEKFISFCTRVCKSPFREEIINYINSDFNLNHNKVMIVLRLLEMVQTNDLEKIDYIHTAISCEVDLYITMCSLIHELTPPPTAHTSNKAKIIEFKRRKKVD